MFLRALVNGDFDQALGSLTSVANPDGDLWTTEKLRERLDAYYAEHKYICLDPNARNARHTYVIPSEDKLSWRVQQMLVDPQEHNDWVAEFEVDLAQSRSTGEPSLRLRRIAPLAA